MLTPLSKLWLLFFFLLPSCLHAAISAQVNQQTVYQGDKFTLTLEADRKVESRPDFQPLQNDFHIIGSKQVTVSSHSTGIVNARTRWIVDLRPLNEGEQLIPALLIAGEESPSINVQVLPAKDNPTPPSNDNSRQYYLEAELDNDKVHRNSETILRIKVFHLNALPLDATLSTPRASNTLIKAIEEGKKGTEQIKGRSYNTTEYSYALFPKQEGTVEIEPFFFSGTLPNRELMELTSPLLLFSVLPPVSGTTSTSWLPAKDLFIEDNLSETLQLEAGTTLRRIISLHAEGLPASALPSLSALQHDKAKIELLNVVLEEQATPNGFVSSRTEELLITPVNTEKLDIPVIEKGWWNTQSKKWQTVFIPKRVVEITPSSIMKNALADSSLPENTDESSSTGQLLIWILTAISLLSTLGFIYAFNQLRILKKGADDVSETVTADEKRKQQHNSTMSEINTFQALLIACRQNNAEIAQIRLIEWAQSFWGTPNIFTFEEVCEQAQDTTFNYLIMDLEEHLYGHDAGLWKGDLLIEGVERLRKRRNREQHKLNVKGNRLVMDAYPNS